MDNIPKAEWFKLDRSCYKWIYNYFIFQIILTIILTVSLLIVLFNPSLRERLGISVLTASLVGAICTAILGCSIKYIRKLYKSFINLDAADPQNPDEEKRQLGLKHYFILRPLFSIAFAILFILSFKAGSSFLAKYEGLKEEFIYFAMITCFFIGYSSGDFIDKLDNRGKQFIDKVSDELIK